MSITVRCPYCKDAAELVTGSTLYPHLPDLADHYYWMCAPCRAWVGAHKNSADHQPLGRLADATLRRFKQQAHYAFDPLWKTGGMTRREAYAWLAERLEVSVERCHIGWMDVDDCERVIDVMLQHNKEAVNGRA